MGGGEKRRPCGKRRDLHQAPFSSLEAFATPSTPAVLHPQPPLLPAPPSSDGVRSPPSPRRLPTPGAKVGPQRDLGEKQAHTRPHSSPGRPCIVPGALRSPPRGSSSPAAPRRPRPAPPPPRSRYQGPTSGAEGPAAQGARGLDRRRGWETEEGSGEAEAGTGEVRQRRHFPRLPPTDERRAARLRVPLRGWGRRPGRGFEVWGRGPAYSRSAPAVRKPSARSLATDREPDVTEAKRQRPRPPEHVTGRGLAAETSTETLSRALKEPPLT